MQTSLAVARGLVPDNLQPQGEPLDEVDASQGPPATFRTGHPWAVKP